ncbi:hypothetical protein M6B38_411080 [Iris pallida]|uniref:Uncharacterized protein n=1 Tax=Iris pallida TaxID=29817 RepID=A0AAX6FMN0_IRIPA|nr:hypothetical protein M6B38_411080 [Iris pallida]
MMGSGGEQFPRGGSSVEGDVLRSTVARTARRCGSRIDGSAAVYEATTRSTSTDFCSTRRLLTTESNTAEMMDFVEIRRLMKSRRGSREGSVARLLRGGTVSDVQRGLRGGGEEIEARWSAAGRFLNENEARLSDDVEVPRVG